MRTQPIDSRRTDAHVRRVAAAMLVVTLVACGAVQAQERAADVQPGAATVVATVRPIDPTYVGPDPASGSALGFLEDETPQSTAGTSETTDVTVDEAAIGSACSVFNSAYAIKRSMTSARSWFAHPHERAQSAVSSVIACSVIFFLQFHRMAADTSSLSTRRERS